MPYDITYTWNLKYDTNELIYKTETESQIQRMKLWLTKGKGGKEGINKEFGISRYKILYIKQIKSKDLLYNTGAQSQHAGINHSGKY